MPFFPPPLIAQIADFFYKADRFTRLDLSKDKVISERDYLSRFVTLLEHPFGIMGAGHLPFRSMYYANNFPSALEQRFGCDILFVFKYNNEVKLMAIEGKYPRFHERNYRWDYKPRHAHQSHFSDQIIRQANLVSARIEVLEMFINKDAPSIPSIHGHLDLLGSSFVTHAIAQAHTLSTQTWRQIDALDIINTQFTVTNNVSIHYFINELLKCRIGQKREIAYNSNSISIPINKSEILKIPLPDFKNETPGTDSERLILKFMMENGFRTLGYIENNDQK